MKRLLVCQSYITYHVTGDEFTATASQDVIDENERADNNLNEEPLKDGKYYPFISYTYIR